MKRYRPVVAFTVIMFLVFGNFGYLYSYSQGKASEFAAKMSELPIQILTLILLSVVMIFAIVTDPIEPSDIQQEEL
jgi:hypothetical protein